MCDHCGCREYAPIAELTAEHETILSLAWRIAEASRTGAVQDVSVIDALLRRLDLHVAKEEEGLYPLLRDAGDLADDTCTVLEADHVTLRAALSGGAFGRRDYYALAAHIEEEEMELFPAARFGFEDETWDELDAIHRRVQSAVTAPS